jgi:hypothetical protein
MSLFAIPGVALVLPVVGATSDAIGIQASVLALVPVAVASGLILTSAASFVRHDIDAVRSESVSRATAAIVAVQEPDPALNIAHVARAGS